MGNENSLTEAEFQDWYDVFTNCNEAIIFRDVVANFLSAIKTKSRFLKAVKKGNNNLIDILISFKSARKSGIVSQKDGKAMEGLGRLAENYDECGHYAKIANMRMI